MDDERTQEIQKFLVKHLQLTPRRQLFEEYTKQAEVISDEKPTPQECLDKPETFKKIDYSFSKGLSELGDFRKSHPEVCMSDVNRKRLQREKKRDDDFLHSHLLRRKDSDCNPTRLSGLCEKTREKSRETERQPEQLPYVTRCMQYAPDNSPALSHQNYMC